MPAKRTAGKTPPARKEKPEKALAKYREMRDFEKTPEPSAGRPSGDGRLLFMVQKHAATRLHYDFRMEVDGVLKSWPIPNGPSYNPKDKRLAIMTEDHPMDYASFEGVIPKGEYGGGQVIVWDMGTYTPDEDGVTHWDDREEAQRLMREGIAKGKLSFFLQGVKLKGSFTLVKLARSEKGNEWLLIKHKDEWADPERDVIAEDKSVLSGLTIAELKAGRLPDRTQNHFIVNPQDAAGAKRAPLPKLVEPMQATLTERAFSSPDWYFEPKLDGVRSMAYVDGGKVRLLSRTGHDNTRTYPTIAEELSRQQDRQLVLDGEIVALNEKGVPSFQTIQQRLGLQREADIRKMEELIPVYYYVYDLLYCDGHDMRGVQLRDRKALLKERLMPMHHIFLLDHFEEEGEAAYDAAVSFGMEGVMAKRKDSVYESGRRTKTWLKVKKTHEDEFVIGGFTGGTGGRASTFGSLLVGQYNDKGELVYSGNVGTGFDDRTLKKLLAQLEPLKADNSPFDVFVPGNMRFGRSAAAQTTWVKPQLVAGVQFAEWTSDGHLRAPSFKGLRDDKRAKEVHREAVAAAPAGVHVASAGNAEDVLEQLRQEKDRFVLRVGDAKISLTNLDKPLWPEWQGRRPLTKRDLLVYFAEVSPYLLPQMRDRPITLTRYPNGIDDLHFYQKHFEAKIPEFVETAVVWSGQFSVDQEYILCNNLPTLMWLGQLADIELHTWYSRVAEEPDAAHLPEYAGGGEKAFDRSRLNYPDFIVFDLDPYIYSGEEKKGAEPELNRAAFLKTCDVAFWLKELLDGLQLSSFVKTTGKTGLHIYVPIRREFDYDTVRAAAETIGKFLVRAHPRDITMEWSVPKRTGKIFFDHGQNTKGKTLASIYSPRPVPWAGVSVPVRWEELRDIYPTDFTILNACERIRSVGGDLWAGIVGEKHDLGALLEAAGVESLPKIEGEGEVQG